MLIRVLTYNIRGLPWSSTNIYDVGSWLMSSSGADIIALQEVFSQKHRTILEGYAMQRGWVAVFPEDSYLFGNILPRMECGSGLAFLLHPKFLQRKPASFHRYSVSHGADRFVTKGYFVVYLELDGYEFEVFNTHLQSDITEFACIRINYLASRHQQEKELYEAAHSSLFPLVIGDMNMCIFKKFHRLDLETHVTFPETEEHLDHLLYLKRDEDRLWLRRVIYYDSVKLSDHIPVEYVVRLVSEEETRATTEDT